MSKNHIKIFDDTVLKQSINQGTEAQRMASSTSRFTSGELAFTRDTGRIFVGNGSSKNNNEKDMPEIQGGILAGNKYLGYVDSKPLSWWKSGEYSSLPLNYDSESYFNGENVEVSKEDFTKESSILRKDSKYRNKLGKDGKKYEGKWERDAVYNETYDAYNGDYLYDIYQNALILFDTNISEKKDMNREVKDGIEHFCDNNGKEIPIDEQYKRTSISNINSEYHRDHPIYGDGYVIFRNIEVDGKSIKFKDKVFNSDGTTSPSSTIEGYQNQSHNVIEIGTVSAKSMIDALKDNQFDIIDNKIVLDKIIDEVEGFKNEKNTFLLPQKITLSDYEAISPITFNFVETAGKQITDLDEDDLTIKLVGDSKSKNNYHVEIAKSASKELYIKLDEGLHNSGPGNSDYIVLSPSNAGSLSDSTPTISLTKSKNFYVHDNDLTDPFYTLYESDSGNLYVGNLTISQSGVIQGVDQYEEDYKEETIVEREKFDVTENIKTNYLKHPIPIFWTQMRKPDVVTPEEPSPEEPSPEEPTPENPTPDNEIIYPVYENPNIIDVNLEYFIKPYFYCVSKDVFVDNNPIENLTIEKNEFGGEYNISENDKNKFEQFNNRVMVIGNNNYLAKEEDGSYFIIPGYNVSYDYDVTGKSKGNRLFKCNFEAISLNMEDKPELPNGIIKISTKNDVEVKYRVNNKSILKVDENGDYLYDKDYIPNLKEKFETHDIDSSNTLLSDISNIGLESIDENGNSIKTDISDLTDSLFDVECEYAVDENGNDKVDENGHKIIIKKVINDVSEFCKRFSYSNFENIDSLIDFEVETELEYDDKTKSYVIKVVEIAEETSRNTAKLNLTGEITKVSINGIGTESDAFQSLLDYDSAYDAIQTLENILAYIDTNEAYISYKENNESYSKDDIAWYDHKTGLVWSKTSDGLDNSSYIASLYYNSDIILSEENLSTTLCFDILDDDSSFEDDTKQYYSSIVEDMPFYKTFTIYRKYYVDENSDYKNEYGKSTYYTSAEEDMITNEDKRYLGLIQIIRTEIATNKTTGETNEVDIIDNYTPEEFWNMCSANEDENKDVIHLDINDVINSLQIGKQNNTVKAINLINISEKYEETIKEESYYDKDGNKIVKKVSYYDVDDNQIVADDGGYDEEHEITLENGEKIDISDMEEIEEDHSYSDSSDTENGDESGDSSTDTETISTFSLTRNGEEEDNITPDTENGENNTTNTGDENVNGGSNPDTENGDGNGDSSTDTENGDGNGDSSSGTENEGENEGDSTEGDSSGGDSSDNEKVETPDEILVTRYDVDSFVMAPVYWSEKGYHTPSSYKVFLEGEYDEKMSIEDAHCVVIPDHANEIILEVRHMTSENKPITIFTAKEKNLLKNDFSSTNSEWDILMPEKAYSDYDGKFKLQIPIVEEDNNRMQPNKNEKCILYSDSISTDIIRVPLYRSECENSKRFVLRISGLTSPSLDEKLLIRLIGYTA